MNTHKPMTIDDWEAVIKASPTGCQRTVHNLLIKQAGGHRLSPTEQHCLAAWERVVKGREEA